MTIWRVATENLNTAPTEIIAVYGKQRNEIVVHYLYRSKATGTLIFNAVILLSVSPLLVLAATLKSISSISIPDLCNLIMHHHDCSKDR